VGRVGVLGGTFDPPHYGHLALAEAALTQLELAQVLFVPAGSPPHKPGRPITAAHHRAAMVEAAVAGQPAFALSRVDLDRPGPHYTVDMLALLRQALPGSELYFLLGSDSLHDLPSWRDPAGIVRQACLAVLGRPGWEADWEALERAVPGLRGRLVRLEAPLLAISSTDLRWRARQGLPLTGLVPPAVEEYILQHGIYLHPREKSKFSAPSAVEEAC
jgi:nicotinate-nucleotide adenylyltransferase